MKKRVARIQLYEAGIQIAHNNHIDDPFGGFGKVKKFLIPGEDIAEIAEAIGIESGFTFQDIEYQNKDGKITSKQVRRHLSETQLEIFQVLEDFDIKNLERIEAEVLSPHLVDITLFYSNDKDPDIPFTQEITYSGSFCIDWWTESWDEN